MKKTTLQIKDVKLNEANPRYIRGHKLEKLKKSLKEFPEMLGVRPIVVDEDNVVLGGNMRVRALLDLGHKEVEAYQVSGWSESQKREFLIKDNANFGEWDWDILANTWDQNLLSDWGLNVDFGIQDQFDLDELEPSEEESDGGEEGHRLTDDEYSSWDIILRYDNKLKLIEALNLAKELHGIDKTEDALMIITLKYLEDARK